MADELGAPHMAVECDVQSPDSVRAAFAAIAKVHPKIDVLINNAAIYEPFHVAKATDAQILNSIHTNLAGPIFTCREAIPMMEKDGYIINVTSESVALDFPMLSLYQCTKAGLERFTQTLSKELDPAGNPCQHGAGGADDGRGARALTGDMAVAMEFHQSLRRRGHQSDAAPGVARQFGHRRVPRAARSAGRCAGNACLG